MKYIIVFLKLLLCLCFVNIDDFTEIILDVKRELVVKYLSLNSFSLETTF